MAKVSLPDIAAQFASTAALNDRFNTIEDELNDKVLYRNNPAGEPNEMFNSLDMNLNRLLNLPSPQGDSDPVRWGDVKDGLSVIEEPVPSQSGNEDRALSTTGTTLVFKDGNDLSYDQGGTGSVRRTLGGKLQERVSVKDFGVVGDGVTDDTAAIQAALDYIDSLNTGSAVLEPSPVLSLGGLSFAVSSQLISPTSRYSLDGDGQSVFIVDGMPNSTPLFDTFPRGSVISDIVIKDSSQSKTKYGWHFENTSGIYFKNIGSAWLARGMSLKAANDFRGAHGYHTFENALDLYVGDPADISSSISFESFRFDDSDKCIDGDGSLTNMHFLNGGFIMKPTVANTVNVDLSANFLSGCSIKGCRFEHKGTATDITHLKIRGASGVFQAHIDVEGNYFTSSNVLNHIELAGNINRSPLENNHFQSEPNNADILNSASNDNLDIRDNNTFDPSRATQYVIFKDTGSAAYQEHGVKPVLIKHDRMSLPAPSAGGTGDKVATITLSTLTRAPNIDMPTSVTDYSVYWRSNVSGAELSGEPLIVKFFLNTVEVHYSVKTAGSDANGAIEFDLYLWGY